MLDSQGQRVGELLDVLVDMHAGRVAYGVVVLDHAPEWSERLIAVPWNTMYMQVDGDGICVNATRDWIERAPSMRVAAMNELLDRELGRIHPCLFRREAVLGACRTTLLAARGQNRRP